MDVKELGVSPEDVLREARSLIGVSFRLGGYEFLATVARRLGIIDKRTLLCYVDDDEITSSIRHCVIARRLSTEIAFDEIQPGDVALLVLPAPSGRYRVEWPTIVSGIRPLLYIMAKPGMAVAEEEDEDTLRLDRAFRFDNDKIKNPNFDHDTIRAETLSLMLRTHAVVTMEYLLYQLRGGF